MGPREGLGSSQGLNAVCVVGPAKSVLERTVWSCARAVGALLWYWRNGYRAVCQAYDPQAPEFELVRELIAARTQAAGARHPCEQSNVFPAPWKRVPCCAWSL